MEHYSTYASLLCYPTSELKEAVKKNEAIILKDYPENKGNINAFQSFVEDLPLDKQREYYIRTFDVQALCYLDIGYILFGEDYKRGEFLVNMQKEHKKAENNCGSELADHLPNMLNLLPKIKDVEFAKELAYSIMIPALKEMLKRFKDEDNVYRKILSILLNLMEKDFKGLDYKQFKINNNDKTNFLKNINCKNKSCKSRKQRV